MHALWDIFHACKGQVKRYNTGQTHVLQVSTSSPIHGDWELTCTMQGQFLIK